MIYVVILLLMKLFWHFNLSILRMFFILIREFLVNAKNMVLFSVVLGGANETP